MSTHRTLMALTLCAAGLSPAAPGLARAQAPPSPKPAGGFASLEELRDSYFKQLVELDRHRIADLTTLAAKLSKEDAEEVYRELLNLAVGRELFSEAEKAAQTYLASGPMDARDRSLATLVALIAKANRGEYDQSLADLQAAFKNRVVAADPNARVDPSTSIALGEAYLQRLIRGGRYDIATKVCNLAIERLPDPEVKAHFQKRLVRLAMVGQMAPEIVGKDVDGKIVKLSDLKGKVVLIDFWATWCPPCVAAFPELKALDTKYGDKGFEIFAVNLDAAHQQVGAIEKASPLVRQYLMMGRATWPNILVDPVTKNDPTEAYAVTEIPASFLVDRSGKIIAVEQSGFELGKAVEAAVKAK